MVLDHAVQSEAKILFRLTVFSQQLIGCLASFMLRLIMPTMTMSLARRLRCTALLEPITLPKQQLVHCCLVGRPLAASGIFDQMSLWSSVSRIR